MHAESLQAPPRPAARNLVDRAWAALCHAWQAHRRHAQDLQLLSQMSARDLSDLGLGRGEIERITAAPLSERRHG
ncbi:MAG TPA: DUF1127 domain-containing protein [Burkholderiaceae bacterium]|jgi:uncharacterized protein YjiS (DUF1127 family)|nr:DUF1127 domain-containing protein [Burkholderiaceae bacterium]